MDDDSAFVLVAVLVGLMVIGLAVLIGVMISSSRHETSQIAACPYPLERQFVVVGKAEGKDINLTVCK